MNKHEFLADGDTFTHAGHTFIVSIEDDGDQGYPWANSDGHGPVTDWLTRDKKPGERVLYADRNSKRFYDVAEATRIAKREGWGLGDEGLQALIQRKEYNWRNAHNKGRLVKLPPLSGPMEKPTPGEITAQAVENDFEYLQSWCNDEWRYVGACVRHVSQDPDDRYSYATWGIESNADDYLTVTAHELASECLRAIEAEKASARADMATDRELFKRMARELRAAYPMGETLCNVLRAKLVDIVESRHASMARIAELSA